MTQPHPGYLAVQPGHPEPEPIPEPEPPQPIPPPDPAPPPEPPHASGGADFIDAGPPTTDLEWPPAGAYPGEPGYRDPAEDQPTTSLPLSGAEQATEAIPAMADRTEPIAEPGDPTEPIGEPGNQTEPIGEPGNQTEPIGVTGDRTESIGVMGDRTELIGLPGGDQTELIGLTGDQTQPVSTGWQQPPPTGPWPARHELAAPPPAEVPLLEMEPERTRQRRSSLWVPLALVITLLLCAAGATSVYLLLRNADSGRGASDPATAVDHFMTAVYTDRDASAAADLVCREARDEPKLNARVNQIKSYASAYDQPAFRWSDPAVASQNDERAVVTLQLTMSTDDEKQAQQELTFTVVHKTGWQVCDIAS